MRAITRFKGVKQAAIISQIWFCIYIDGLLRKLEGSRVGCFVGKFLVGDLAYADDLTLLAPHPEVCRLLTKCEEYAYEFDIVFNGAKPKCLFITPTNYNLHAIGSKPTLTTNGNVIDGRK
jgi:hypothetical protein